MDELLVVIVLALLVIAAATVVGPRLGIAAPLVLVAIGVGASFLPVFESVEIEPEWILAGVLPPLLYSSAVSMPAMNFRREFGAISGLSVLLVVASALVLGLFFMLVLPDLGFAWGVALGAIVSPTDAVATSIIKKTSVSQRVVAILDGESLLNDATALVLLRTAIVATAVSFSFWGAVGTFAYSVVVAVLIGLAVGWLNLAVRKRVTDPTVNTVISFTVPFIAFVPAEALEASGLVAAVVAGLVTGIGAPRDLSPQNRLSDTQNWRTVELVLEGAVFLTMGVQITSIVADVEADHGGVGTAVLIAAGALVLTILVRAAYVAPLLGVLARRAQHGEKMKPRMQEFQERIATPEGTQESFQEVNRRGSQATDRDLDRFARRVRQSVADIDYFLREPLGLARGHRGGVGGDARRGHGGRGADASRRHPAAVGPRPDRVRGRDDVAAHPGRHHRPAPAPHHPAGRPGRARRADPRRAAAALRAAAIERRGHPAAADAHGGPHPPEQFETRRPTGSPSSERSGRRCSTPATTGPSTPTSWTTRWPTSTRPRSPSRCAAGSPAERHHASEGDHGNRGRNCPRAAPSDNREDAA